MQFESRKRNIHEQGAKAELYMALTMNWQRTDESGYDNFFIKEDAPEKRKVKANSTTGKAEQISTNIQLNHDRVM